MKDLVDDRYEILEMLGHGGAATVYLARDEVLGRDVALKVLNREYADDDEFVERFKREARSAASLSHPNIVSIYDSGESEEAGQNTYYIAMEYVPRGTLEDRIQKSGRLNHRSVVGVALQIAEALRAAHGRGVIHRDIKPQNVLITENGDAKVTDFGIARATSSSTITQEGFAPGTAAYMSPEQAAGVEVGPASDLYSLGVVMYEMLTGELPNRNGSPPASPKATNARIPKEVEDLVLGLLAKNPDNRPANASSVVEELRRIAERSRSTEAPGATKVSRTSPARRPAHPGSTYRGGSRGARGPNFANVIPWLFAILFIVVVVLAGLIFWRLLGTTPVP